MKTLGIVLFCLFVASCSSLILREDDTTGQTIAKVATRSLIALPTLFMSEAHISNLKRTAKRTELRQNRLCALENSVKVKATSLEHRNTRAASLSN